MYVFSQEMKGGGNLQEGGWLSQTAEAVGEEAFAATWSKLCGGSEKGVERESL